MVATRLLLPVLLLTRISSTWGGAQVIRGQQLGVESHSVLVNVYSSKCWEHTCSGAEVHALQGYELPDNCGSVDV